MLRVISGGRHPDRQRVGQHRGLGEALVVVVLVRIGNGMVAWCIPTSSHTTRAVSIVIVGMVAQVAVAAAAHLTLVVAILMMSIAAGGRAAAAIVLILPLWRLGQPTSLVVMMFLLHKATSTTQRKETALAAKAADVASTPTGLTTHQATAHSHTISRAGRRCRCQKIQTRIIGMVR
jgi:hypothetical protein